MKNTKKLAFLCIAINIILLLQLCLGTVMALDDEAAYIELEQTVEEAVIEAHGAEMQIMAAAGCPTGTSETGRDTGSGTETINGWGDYKFEIISYSDGSTVTTTTYSSATPNGTTCVTTYRPSSGSSSVWK